MLIEEFARAQKTNDIKRMKEIATLLLHFKSYSQCVDAYIEQSQEVSYYTPGMYVPHWVKRFPFGLKY